MTFQYCQSIFKSTKIYDAMCFNNSNRLKNRLKIQTLYNKIYIYILLCCDEQESDALQTI